MYFRSTKTNAMKNHKETSVQKFTGSLLTPKELYKLQGGSSNSRPARDPNPTLKWEI